MKVSVITVCFNSAATIRGCLRSVAEQSYPDIEHVVIDGGSSDGTVDILRGSKSIARFVSEPDRGIYDAMNKGLSAATGDLIGFLNADDELADDSSIDALARERARAGADVVYGDLTYVDVNDINRVVRHWRAGRFDRSRLKFGWMPPHPTFYVGRGLLDRIGRFNPGFRIAADYDFMLRCLGTADIAVAYVPKVIVRMRVGGISNRSLSSMWKKSSEDLAALRGNRVGGIGTLICKNVRKLPQFLRRRSAPAA